MLNKETLTRLGREIFRMHVGDHDYALLVAKYGEDYVNHISTPYERYVGTVVGVLAREGGTLPTSWTEEAGDDVDPLA
jgi:hypothetical protein